MASGWREFAEAGGLLSYGPDRVQIAPAYPYSTDPDTDPPVVMEHDGTDWFLIQ